MPLLVPVSPERRSQIPHLSLRGAEAGGGIVMRVAADRVKSEDEKRGVSRTADKFRMTRSPPKSEMPAAD